MELEEEIVRRGRMRSKVIKETEKKCKEINET